VSEMLHTNGLAHLIILFAMLAVLAKN